MKIALNKTRISQIKPSSSTQQQPTAAKIQRNRNRKRIITKDKIKIETHLTIIGVCTTICPEKSGT
jgi:hypothetical protein